MRSLKEPRRNFLQLTDSLKIGGAEIIAANVAIGLYERGYRGAVCGIGRDGELSEILRQKGLKTYWLDQAFGLSPRLMWDIGSLMVKERAGIVLTHHFRQLAHSVLPAFALRRRLVHIEHDYHFYDGNELLVKRLDSLMRFADALITVSHDAGIWFHDRLPRHSHKMFVIENGVDTQRFCADVQKNSKSREQYRIPPEAFVVGTCARLYPIKNLPFLVEGFAAFQKHCPEARLVIVGEGPELPVLQERAGSLGIGEQIIFPGVQSSVEDFLAMFDVYAITSHNEGLPVSVLEAMSSELPVISTRVGALPDVVGPETGMLIEGDDVNGLAAALRSLYDNKAVAEKKGKAAREFVHKRYSLDVMLDRYRDVLDQVRGEGRPRG